MRTRLSIWVLVGALACAPGCDKSDAAATPSEAATTEKKGPTDAQKAEGKAIQSGVAKLNLYVECLNAASANVEAAGQHWNTWIRNDSKPLRGQALNAKKECTDKLDRAKAMSPPMPELHKTGRIFGEAFTKLDQAYKARHTFATSKGYTSGDRKALEPFDAAINQALIGVAKPETAFIAAFTSAQAKHNKRQLAFIAETEGKNLRYLHMVMMNSAKDLMATVSDPKQDKAAVEAAAVTFEKDHQAALAYYDANSKEYRGKAMYRSIQIPGQTLVREAKTAAKNRAEPQEGVATVSRHYSDFVRTANRLH